LNLPVCCTGKSATVIYVVEVRIALLLLLLLPRSGGRKQVCDMDKEVVVLVAMRMLRAKIGISAVIPAASTVCFLLHMDHHIMIKASCIVRVAFADPELVWHSITWCVTCKSSSATRC
jgi:hypothetical protein